MAQRTYQKNSRCDVDLIRRAQAIAPRIAQRAPAADKAREIPFETVRDLHEAGLLSMSIPRFLGGTEANLLTQAVAYEIIGSACASTGWCLGNHNQTCSRLQGMLPPENSAFILRSVAEEGSVLAHAQIPAGTTTIEPGGYRFSGRWPFVSFSNHATWIFLSTMVPGPPPDWQPAGDAPAPQAHNRWLGVRCPEPKLRIEPTWQAMSVRASMSNDVVVDDVFVPEALAAVGRRPTAGECWDPTAPPALLVPVGARVWMPAIMLGVAQSALDETIEYAKARPMILGGLPQGSLRASMPGNQFAVADAAIAIEAGRAYLMREAEALVDRAESGEPFGSDDVIRMQMADLVARENAQKAVDRLFAIRGGNGLYEIGNFERYYRDVRVGTLHALTTPDTIREAVGKHLFDIPGGISPRWG